MQIWLFWFELFNLYLLNKNLKNLQKLIYFQNFKILDAIWEVVLPVKIMELAFQMDYVNADKVLLV